MKCHFCTKTYENKIGFSNHVRRCPKNPHRILEIITPEGKEKIKAHLIKMNEGRWKDPKNRQKHSEIMKKVVLQNPESYTSSNRGRTKQIVLDGIKFQGQWEVDFYLWAKESGLSPERPKESFQYEWHGIRWYHPDFYIPSLNLYVEVKGYETERDQAKWVAFPKKLRIIKAAEIKKIREGCFEGL